MNKNLKKIFKGTRMIKKNTLLIALLFMSSILSAEIELTQDAFAKYMKIAPSYQHFIEKVKQHPEYDEMTDRISDKDIHCQWNNHFSELLTIKNLRGVDPLWQEQKANFQSVEFTPIEFLTLNLKVNWPMLKLINNGSSSFDIIQGVQESLDKATDPQMQQILNQQLASLKNARNQSNLFYQLLDKCMTYDEKSLTESMFEQQHPFYQAIME